MIGRLVAIVVLLLAAGCSDGAEQHPAGLEEGDQKRLFGLRPVPPDDSCRLRINATSFFEKTRGTFKKKTPFQPVVRCDR